MTVYPPQILLELKNYHLFLDTGVFVYAAKNESFFELLIGLKEEAHCTFSTIPSVVFEFTNGSRSLDDYNQRVRFVKSLVGFIDPMHFLNQIPDFFVVMSKVNKRNKAYTDFLLAACLYKYKHVKVALITLDLQAFPPFYPRTQIIAIEQKDEIRNFGIYQFNADGYAAAAAKALEEAEAPEDK